MDSQPAPSASPGSLVQHRATTEAARFLPYVTRAQQVGLPIARVLLNVRCARQDGLGRFQAALMSQDALPACLDNMQPLQRLVNNVRLGSSVLEVVASPAVFAIPVDMRVQKRATAVAIHVQLGNTASAPRVLIL